MGDSDGRTLGKRDSASVGPIEGPLFDDPEGIELVASVGEILGPRVGNSGIEMTETT